MRGLCAMPATSEPHLVWIVEGSVICEEREPGTTWCAANASAGMFFLTTGRGPYEFRWRGAALAKNPS